MMANVLLVVVFTIILMKIKSQLYVHYVVISIRIV